MGEGEEKEFKIDLTSPNPLDKQNPIKQTENLTQGNVESKPKEDSDPKTKGYPRWWEQPMEPSSQKVEDSSPTETPIASNETVETTQEQENIVFMETLVSSFPDAFVKFKDVNGIESYQAGLLTPTPERSTNVMKYKNLLRSIPEFSELFNKPSYELTVVDHAIRLFSSVNRKQGLFFSKKGLSFLRESPNFEQNIDLDDPNQIYLISEPLKDFSKLELQYLVNSLDIINTLNKDYKQTYLEKGVTLEDLKYAIGNINSIYPPTETEN